MPFSFEFDSAIAAHKSWIKHLEWHLDGIERVGISVSEAGNTHVCALGKWLDANIERYASLDGFQNLREQHGLFHEEAANVIRLIEDKQMAAAETLLKGRLSELSANINHLIELMKHAYHAR